MGKRRFSPLKALGCLLGFFAKLETLVRRLGIHSIARDPIIIALLLLVLLVYGAVLLVQFAVRASRQAVCFLRNAFASSDSACHGVIDDEPMQPTVRSSSRSCSSHEAFAAEGSCLPTLLHLSGGGSGLTSAAGAGPGACHKPESAKGQVCATGRFGSKK